MFLSVCLVCESLSYDCCCCQPDWRFDVHIRTREFTVIHNTRYFSTLRTTFELFGIDSTIPQLNSIFFFFFLFLASNTNCFFGSQFDILNGGRQHSHITHAYTTRAQRQAAHTKLTSSCRDSNQKIGTSEKWFKSSRDYLSLYFGGVDNGFTLFRFWCCVVVAMSLGRSWRWRSEHGI